MWPSDHARTVARGTTLLDCAAWLRSRSSAPARWGARSAARCSAAGRAWWRRWPGGASGRSGWRVTPGSSCCRRSVRWSRGPTSCSRSSRRARRKRWPPSSPVRGSLVDLNAVSPETARRISREVDGSISGPPPTGPGTTRDLPLRPAGGRGRRAAVRRRAGRRGRGRRRPRLCREDEHRIGVQGLGRAPAQALRAADSYGVLEHVLDDLGELASGAGRRIARAAAKADRYVGEMREISAAQAAAGLDPALFEAMAKVYARSRRRRSGGGAGGAPGARAALRRSGTRSG